VATQRGNIPSFAGDLMPRPEISHWRMTEHGLLDFSGEVIVALVAYDAMGQHSFLAADGLRHDVFDT